MLSKFKGVAIIHLYDKDGKKIAEFAKPEFESRFSWLLFAVIFTLGLAIIGHV